jgi:nucleoside-diphosphate-sugar epimerase
LKILVLGGTGFISSAAVRALAASGHEVVVYNRGSTPAELPAAVRRIEGDRSAIGERRAELRALAPDVVLDAIAYTRADAELVPEVFAGVAARSVVLSSIDVYRAYGRLQRSEPGPPEPVPFDEDAPLRDLRFPYRTDPRRAGDDPRSWMDDYDKILVEEAFRARPELPATVLRLPMVYGPGDPQRRFAPYVARMREGKDIVLEQQHASWRSSWGFVDDVGAAIAAAATEPRASGRTYNVCELEPPSMAELVRELGVAASWTGELRTAPIEQLPEVVAAPSRAADFRHDLVADSSRLRSELGFVEPTDRPTALGRTVEWELRST